MKKNISTIIEITDSHVKLFQFKNLRKRYIITSCDIKPVHSRTEDEIIEILIGLIRSKSIQTDNLIFAVPRRFAILKQIRLPSQNMDEIKKMVELQLVNKVPYPLEDISYHCYFLDQDDSGHSKVLVIVLHKEVSDRYLRIFDKAGMALNRLTLSSFGILEWLEYQKHKKKIRGDGPVAIVDIDMLYTEICFCHNGKLLFSRSFDGGARDLNGDNVFHLVKQIELSLGAYRKEDMGPAIHEIIILSILPEGEHLRDKLEDKLQISTKVLMPAENILYQKNMKLPTLEERSGASLSVGLGLGLSNIRKLVNLAPQKVHDTKQGKIRKSRWFRFIFLFLLASTLGASILSIEFSQRRVCLAELKVKIEEVKPEAHRALQQMQFIKSFNEEFGKRVLMSDLIYSLYDLIHEEISFRSLDLNEKGRLTIQGYAQTSGSVNTFQAGLVKSPVFKEVNLQFASKRKIFNMEVTDFKIDAQLTIAEKQNND